MGMESFGVPLNPQEQRVVDLAGSAVESTNVALLQGNIERVVANLANIKSADWIQLRTAVENLEGEEKRAVDSAVSMLGRMRDLQDKESVVRRAARDVVDLARARKVLEDLPGISQDIVWGAKCLYEAVALVADEKDVQESLRYSPAVMTPEELEAAKERVRNTKVS